MLVMVPGTKSFGVMVPWQLCLVSQGSPVSPGWIGAHAPCTAQRGVFSHKEPLQMECIKGKHQVTGPTHITLMKKRVSGRLGMMTGLGEEGPLGQLTTSSCVLLVLDTSVPH